MSLYQRAGSRFWWYRFEVAGEEFRGSTNETDRARALRHEAQRKLDAQASAPLVSSSRGLGRLRSLAAEDVKDAEDRGAHEGYLRSLRWMWKAIDATFSVEFGADASVRDVSLDTVKRHVARRRDEGIRGQSIRREVAALKRVCIVAADRGWLLRVPPMWPKVKSDPPHPTRRGKLRSPEKIREILDSMPEDVRDEYRFAAFTGLRAAEVGRVEAYWMEPSASGPLLRVPAWASKTREERTVMLSAPAIEILRRRESRTPVFTGSDFQTRVRAASLAAGLTSALTLRDLRVYYATTGLQRSGDATAVQEQVGHEDLRTTQRYMRSTLDRDAAVSDAVAASLEPAQKGRHRSARSRADKAFDSGALPAKQASTGSAVPDCPVCAAELQRIAAEHAKGRHMSVGTVSPIRRSA